jgi:hypothetical protein
MNFDACRYESDFYSPQQLHFGNNSNCVKPAWTFLWGSLNPQCPKSNYVVNGIKSMSSGFHHEASENCALLGHYTVSSVKKLLPVE